MLVAAAERILGTVDELVVVMRPGADGLTERLEAMGCRILYCPQAVDGMGNSLSCGVRASRQADAWLVALGDMPFVAADTVEQIVETLRQGAVLVAPSYEGKRGHPVGFGRVFLRDLEHLTGDEGARRVLRENRRRLEILQTRDRGVILDVDTPEDLTRGAGGG
jgi:molybdenum cofactor cytidylyltransferase